MLLLTDCIGFSEPGFGLLVNLRGSGESKMVDMVSAGNCFNAAEAWMLQFAREDHMAVNPTRMRCHLGKGHSDLKRNACLLRQHNHRATAPNRLEHGVENRTDLCRFASKM